MNILFLLFPVIVSHNQSYERYTPEKKEKILTITELAIQEHRIYGVPASITLAQYILESDNGRSAVAKKYNNVFGIRKECKYVYYKSIEDCFRHHSKILSGKRYKQFIGKSYREWAVGLKKNGYAEDKNYDKKICSLIKSRKLYDYDVHRDILR